MLGAEKSIYLEEQSNFQISREVVKSSLSIHPSEEENRSKVPLGVYLLESNANDLAGTKKGILSKYKISGAGASQNAGI